MSLSDVLIQAEDDIVYWLTAHDYGNEVRERIEKMLEEIDAVRLLPGLDTPPNSLAPEKRSATQIVTAFVEMQAKRNLAHPDLASSMGLGADSYDPEVVAEVQRIRTIEEAAEATSEKATKERPTGEGVAAAHQIPINKPGSPRLRSR